MTSLASFHVHDPSQPTSALWKKTGPGWTLPASSLAIPSTRLPQCWEEAPTQSQGESNATSLGGPHSILSSGYWPAPVQVSIPHR